jgi:hypothetical protein
LIGLLPELVGLEIFFDLEVSLFSSSQLYAGFGEREGMIP